MSLTRDMSNRMIAGVCSGLAKYLNWDVILVRIGVLALWILGIGIGWVTVPVVYLLMWLLVPKSGEANNLKVAWNLEEVKAEAEAENKD